MTQPTWNIDASDFKPTRSQWRFLKSRAAFVMFSGGYGAGKTRTGAEKALDLVAANPGVSGLAVSPTYQMSRRTTREALRQAFPRKIYRERAADKEWELVNGGKIFFGSADKPGSLEGTNVGWIWIDEGRLVPAEAWRTVVGRLRDKRARWLQGFVTTTPAMGWLHDEFGTDVPGIRERIVASTRENAANLAPGFVEQLERTFTKRQARALIDGEFTLASGAVFEEWSPARNLVPWDIQPHLPTYLMIDFGVRKPAVLLAQVPSFDIFVGGQTIPRGTIVVADELHPDETPTVRLVEKIRDRVAVAHPDGDLLRPGRQRARPELRDAERPHAGDGVRHGGRHGPAPGALLDRSGGTLDSERHRAPAGRHRARVRGAAARRREATRGPEVAIEARDRRGDGGGQVPGEGDRRQPDHPVKDGELEHAHDALRYGVQGILRDEGAVSPNLRLLRGYAGGR